MKRRTILTGTAMAASLAAISGCGGALGGGGDSETELRLFHRWPQEPYNTYFTNLVEKFTSESDGTTVSVDSVINDSYKDKVRVTVGSDSSPDVFFSWSGSFARSLVETGNVMELEELVSELETTIIPNQLEPFKVDGKLVGLPISMNGKMFFYNKKIFDENGLSAPSTWDELIGLCKTLKDAGITPISYGSKDAWTVAHYIGTLNQRVLPEDVIDKDTDPKTGEFTNSGYVQALSYLQELVTYMTADPNAVAHQQARDDWLAGNAAIMYLESSEWSYIEDDEFEWGTFNFPSMPDGEGDQNGLTGAPEGFMIAKNTSLVEDSKKFMKLLLSKEESIAWTNASGYLTPVEGALDDTDAPDAVKEIGHQIAEASSMTPWLDNLLDPSIVATYLAQGQSVIGGGSTPEEAMAAVIEKATEVRG